MTKDSLLEFIVREFPVSDPKRDIDIEKDKVTRNWRIVVFSDRFKKGEFQGNAGRLWKALDEKFGDEEMKGISFAMGINPADRELVLS